jgi:acyl-CoA synthetase (AMP-forming)/AMP-acid ligase II
VILRGRSGEVLNVGGVKVDPASVEAELGALPDVDDLAILSLEGSSGAPEVVIAVVATASVDLDRLGEAFTAAAQVLRLTTVFRVSGIPRNQMGNVLRTELLEAYRAAERIEGDG